MNFKHLKKITSVLLALFMLAGIVNCIPAFADNTVEFILEDITNDENTMMGEAKIKVYVKGNVSSADIIQASFTFSGNLKYNATEYLLGENSVSQGKVQQSTDPSSANSSKAFTSSIMSVNSPLSLSTYQEAFIISFTGQPGQTVSLTIDSENSYVRSESVKYYSKLNTTAQASAATQAKETTEAKVELVIDKVNGFYANPQMPVSVEITNERTLKSVQAIIKDENRTSISPLTYLITKNVIKGDKYTVTVSANGYIPFETQNYDFSKTLIVDNSKFIPGDVNGDEKVDSKDKGIYLELIKNKEYSAKSDFNCDGKTDDLDDVFEGIESSVPKDEPQNTVPAKMSAPTLKATVNIVNVSWTAPQNGGSEITGYIIEYGTNNNNLNLKKEITNPTATNENLTPLSPNTFYYIRIAAKNSVGTGSFSDTVSIKTPNESAPGGSGGGAGGGGGSSGGGFGGGGFGGSAGTGGQTTVPTPSEPFTDLGNHQWAKESIYILKNKGIINGISANEYAPASNVKRGDFILILTRMLNISDNFAENFADVPSDKYYYSAIGSAKSAGIATGDGTNFMPENTITRQDLITLAYRAFVAKGYLTETNDLSVLDSFGDKANISEYALSPMASMVSAGIIKGDNGNVNPKGNATRAEVAVMCARLLELIK